MRITIRLTFLFFGLFFLISAILKLLYPSNVKIVESFTLNNIFFILLVQLECVIGICLIVKPFKKIIYSGFILVFIFTSYTFIKLIAGSETDCGCFGNVIKRDIQDSFIQDILLLGIYVIALILYENNLKYKIGKFFPKASSTK